MVSIETKVLKEELKMKKIFTFVVASLLLLSAICLDVNAAKKSSKISKEVVQEMSDNIDNITKKIYARALLSPQDNETLIGLERAFYEIVLQTNRIYNGIEQYAWEIQDTCVINDYVNNFIIITNH